MIDRNSKEYYKGFASGVEYFLFGLACVRMSQEVRDEVRAIANVCLRDNDARYERNRVYAPKVTRPAGKLELVKG